MKNLVIFGLAFTLLTCSCGKQATSSTTTETSNKYVQVSPEFNSDSAYLYIQKQVDFGPRVPNTKEHVACGEYLASELNRLGAYVQQQKMQVTAYDGTKLNARNIIGSYGLEKETRVLLFAHWDTRPWSDHDADKANYNKPVLGANDGASGVGVLLEIARQMNEKTPTVGVDIIFFDAEDYGPPAFWDGADDGDWWCLGTQYWAKNLHTPNYTAKYGILLDMVGAPSATFYREGVSMYYAQDVVYKVWTTASQLGYGSYFISETMGQMTDDHLYVNQLAKIPSIDIIQQDKKSPKSFGHYWHTQNDDMRYIDKNTLKAVGQTVMEVVYNEK